MFKALQECRRQEEFGDGVRILERLYVRSCKILNQEQRSRGPRQTADVGSHLDTLFGSGMRPDMNLPSR
jgi:hypothetical protein